MSRVILALSPHLDDAVFSAGAALAARADAGDAVTVATLFTGNVTAPTAFALACQLDKGLPPEIDYMAVRRNEDRHACAVLGVTPLHLPLLEAPHRGYDSAAALFGPVRADDSAIISLSEVIATLLHEFEPAEIWAPRALGGHVDHVLTHRAIRAAARGRTLRWWTDWPYADRATPADPEAASLTGHLWRDAPLGPACRARKAEACAAYHSQLGFQFGGAAALRDRVAAMTTERFALTPSPVGAA